MVFKACSKEVTSGDTRGGMAADLRDGVRTGKIKRTPEMESYTPSACRFLFTFDRFATSFASMVTTRTSARNLAMRCDAVHAIRAVELLRHGMCQQMTPHSADN